MSNKKHAWAGAMVTQAQAAATEVKQGISFAERMGSLERLQLGQAHPPQEGLSSLLPLDDIKPRESDLRMLRDVHVQSLASSIAVVGLISPLAVDLQGRLLAGEHRRAALALLRDLGSKPELAEAIWPDLEPSDRQRICETWMREGFDKGIPVRRMDFVVSADGERALAVETVENTQRLDFTRDEVVAVYEKLKEAGYKPTVGRPKKGEKALMPALSLIFGRHVRTIQRTLDDAGPTAPASRSAAEKAAHKRLQVAYGVKVDLKFNPKKNEGKFTVHFSSLEEFDRLMSLVERT